jgi:type II secretory pathway pseudopilin PulG
MLDKAISFVLLQLVLLLTGLSLAVSASAAILVPDKKELAAGDSLTVEVQKARTSVNIKWRSSKELQLENANQGRAQFKALSPGRALISATVDGQLASTIVRITDAPVVAVPPAISAMPPSVSAPPSAVAHAPAATFAEPMRPVAAANPQQMPARGPWLRDVLPANAMIYIRAPSLWGMLGAPKGNVYDKALKSAAYAAALNTIKGGLLASILPELPQEGRLFGELLLGQLDSPLEIAVMPPAPGASMPEIAASAVFASGDINAVNTLLDKLTQQAPGLALAQPLGADGSGLLTADGLPIPLYYDVLQQRLFLHFTDPSSPAAPVAQWVAGLTAAPTHAMRAAEAKIDSSGQGLFAWANPAPLLAFSEQIGEAQNVGMARAFGGSEIKSVAMGIGSSNGKQRIKMVIDMPQVGFRSFLPAIDAPLSFPTAGEPDAVIMLGLPDPQDLQLLESAMAGLMPPEEMEAYQSAKMQFQQELGFGVEKVLSAFGDELLLLFDQAGQYSALRVRDQAGYQDILARLVERYGLHYERKQLGSGLYHHLIIPPLGQSNLDEIAKEAGELAPLVLRFDSIPSHLYWIEEGEYLVFAQLPQTLMDYRYMSEKRPLGQWLSSTQGIDGHGALLLGSARNPKAPRLVYEWNLMILSILGDLVGRPVDIFALPTPRELALPAQGGYSFAIDSSPQSLGVELVYESTPAEFLLSFGGIQGIAMVGILSAIAIPSYMEFNERALAQQAEIGQQLQQQAEQASQAQQATAPAQAIAQTGQSLMPAMREVWQLQQDVVGFHQNSGRFPNAQELGPMMDPVNDSAIKNLQMEPNTGRILVIFQSSETDGERRLLLTPQMDGETAHWVCDSTLESQLIPIEVCKP